MLQIFPNIYQNEGSLVAQVVENLPAMQETQVWSLGQEDPLEKGMAIHSSILAWSIPWKEELDGLQPVGSQKVKHNGATEWLTSSFPYHNKQDVTWLLTGLHPEHFDLGVLRRFSSAVKACNEWDLGSTPGSERSPGEGNGNLLQYYCLENPMDRGAWWSTVHGTTKSRIQLSDFTSLQILSKESEWSDTLRANIQFANAAFSFL